MKKMFLKLVLLCLWRLDGVFGGVKVKSVKEGDSVTLNSDLTEIKNDDVIQWRFGNTLIAEINVTADRFTVYDDDEFDETFRDKLTLDNQTGSLTITNIRIGNAGYYRLYYNSNSVSKIFLLNVFVEISVKEGDSITLNTDLIYMMEFDMIQWKFGDEDTLLAVVDEMDDGTAVHDDVLDGRFRDRLKMHKKTGSLTITDITTEHTGVYKLQIIGRNYPKTFRVSVRDEVKVSVKEGDSVALKTDLTEMKDRNICLWTFGPNKSLIAKLNRKLREIFLYNGPDGRFRDRLNLDQTGSLTITNITTEHAGLYERTISGNREIRYRFSVSVSGI
ncbi:uncharacterized protein [Chanodichthys erythropterus]|uniref:uncharacterized protein n=1 Tax=Chanodichthys erythropterus TaxID=933992 RepID=UPI00351EE3CA